MVAILSWMGRFFIKLQGKEWRKRQIRKITDRFFHQIKDPTQGKDQVQQNLRFEDLYIAILLVYNDINKYIPGPHHDPPSKERVKQVFKFCDDNEDEEINRDEFFGFFEQMAPEIFNVVRRKVVATLVAAPTVAATTKKTIERVPIIGKFVQWLPKVVYAVLMTIAVVWYQEDYAH